LPGATTSSAPALEVSKVPIRQQHSWTAPFTVWLTNLHELDAAVERVVEPEEEEEVLLHGQELSQLK